MKPGSSLINNNGATIALQELHHRIGSKAADIFVQKPLRLIADPDINHAAKCVYDAVAFLAWDAGGRCEQPIDLIAALANVSRRRTVDSLAALVRAGYIKREKRGRWLADRLTIAASKVAPKRLGHRIAACSCGNVGKLHGSGLCFACVRKAAQERAYREAMEELPSGSTHDEIAARVALKRESKKLLAVGRKLRVA